MLVRCLHCHEPIELPDEGDLSHVNCSACGGSFSLVGERAQNQRGGWGDFCASWPGFSKKNPSKSLIA